MDVVAETNRHIFAGGVIVNGSFFGWRKERNPLVYLQRLPRPQALTDLFWEAIGIAGRKIGLLRHLPCHLMVAVPIGRGAHEHRRDDERASHTHDAHYLGENAIIAPLFERLFARFGKAVVNNGTPVLIYAVIAVGSQQF